MEVVTIAVEVDRMGDELGDSVDEVVEIEPELDIDDGVDAILLSGDDCEDAGREVEDCCELLLGLALAGEDEVCGDG